MKTIYVALFALASLTACGGSDSDEPFQWQPPSEGGDGGDSGDGGEDGEDGGDTGEPIDPGFARPPGTASPTPDNSLFRSEARGEGDYLGNGYAQSISYDAENDTFSVDNLGFDGDNTYSRGRAVGSLAGQYAVYESDQEATDPLNDQPVNQLTHRAIYGVGRSGATQFAIVRTGSYIGYGFGGFVYQRDGAVTLPTSGQASYTGQAAGLRDRNGNGGLEYTTSDVQIDVDFDDFNETTGYRDGAVKGRIYNRRVYDLNGTDVTQNVLDRINTAQGTNLTQIPRALFKIGPSTLDTNGELGGEVFSSYVDSAGEVQEFEAGNFYAIMSGDNAQEIVGVFVLETTVDPVAQSVRDTSGFVIYR